MMAIFSTKAFSMVLSEEKSIVLYRNYDGILTNMSKDFISKIFLIWKNSGYHTLKYSDWLTIMREKSRIYNLNMDNNNNHKEFRINFGV